MLRSPKDPCQRRLKTGPLGRLLAHTESHSACRSVGVLEEPKAVHGAYIGATALWRYRAPSPCSIHFTLIFRLGSRPDVLYPTEASGLPES